MYGFGHLWELVVVLLIALIFVGPKRLPELGSSLGKAIREFRTSTSAVADQITGEAVAALPTAEQDERAGRTAATPPGVAPHAAAPPRDKEAART